MQHSLFSPGLRRGRLGALLVVLFALAILGIGQAIAAEPSRPSTDQLVQIGEWLRQGQQFEAGNRWEEAVAHYEKALREFPDDRGLKRRFDVTRMHYNLQRRFGDSSFRASLDQLTLDEALSLYEEVLVRIQTHYVGAPHWKELLARGADNFEVALNETAFLQRNLPHCPREQVDAFRLLMRRELDQRPIQNPSDACEAVAWVARAAQRHLGLSPVAVVLEFNCGAANCLDIYSAYLTPDQLDEIYSQIEGNFVGLGIELKTQDGRLTIVRVIPRSPAESAGIRPGDQILAVDGRYIDDMSTNDAANLLQGKEGSQVQLVVVAPDATPRTIHAVRRRVDVPSIDEVRIIDQQQGIGYLRLSCFQKSTSRDLDDALWRLHRQGMRGGLIIDLRSNPGGLLIAAVEAVDRFVASGTIVSTRGRDVREGFTYSAHTPGTWHVPLIVLIDKDSASAAEIFAGAIRDHHRGTVIGQRSYGKGSVQGIFPLHSHSSGIRLTTAKFYSPNGRPYSLVGVKPDVDPDQITSHTTARPIGGSVQSTPNDATLAAALDYARRTFPRPAASGQARVQR